MSKTFVKRTYTCNTCGKTSTEVASFMNTHEIKSYYTADMCPEGGIREDKVYKEHLVRDPEYGYVTERRVVECTCQHCGSSDTVKDKVDKWDNVMNFYPPSTAQKFSDGFGKAGL